MGDQITIPRTFAGQLGVADTLPSIRRHYLELYSGQLTTGCVWPIGGLAPLGASTIQPQNGINFLQRNFTVERAFMIGVTRTTSDAATTVHQVDIMGGGTTIARVGGRLWTSTSTARSEIMSTTPLNANIGSATPLRIVVTRKINVANFASIFIVGRERLD